eukprot:TRINITY_DN2630_c0_g1_i1.p1 TRINITY_DN2630_c0_g1~~TRINITY_DN2630_c0_g1_i1.p1  ORF type:complete len:731 (+),score=48.02 TRINITY_DN2630_c0_g1_i1:815-3007(+)
MPAFPWWPSSRMTIPIVAIERILLVAILIFVGQKLSFVGENLSDRQSSVRAIAFGSPSAFTDCSPIPSLEGRLDDLQKHGRDVVVDGHRLTIRCSSLNYQRGLAGPSQSKNTARNSGNRQEVTTTSSFEETRIVNPRWTSILSEDDPSSENGAHFDINVITETSVSQGSNSPPSNDRQPHGSSLLLSTLSLLRVRSFLSSVVSSFLPSASAVIATSAKVDTNPNGPRQFFSPQVNDWSSLLDTWSTGSPTKDIPLQSEQDDTLQVSSSSSGSISGRQSSSLTDRIVASAVTDRVFQTTLSRGWNSSTEKTLRDSGLLLSSQSDKSTSVSDLVTSIIRASDQTASSLNRNRTGESSSSNSSAISRFYSSNSDSRSNRYFDGASSSAGGTFGTINSKSNSDISSDSNRSGRSSRSFGEISSSDSSSSSTYGSAWHTMNDSSLFQKAASIPTNSCTAGMDEKIAFLFLTRGPLPLARFWDRFFRKVPKSLFSIFIHAAPGFQESPLRPKLLRGRQIPSKKVKWGDISVVDAERRLLANALLDPCNARFVLLSEACIPLFNFKHLYRVFFSSPLSYVNAYDLPGPNGRDRYVSQMLPEISSSQWMKSAQWFEVTRELALTIITDTLFYPKFKQYCLHTCISDEHYIPTLLSIKHPTNITRTAVTYVNWQYAGAAHPRTYHAGNFSKKKLRNMRGRGCHLHPSLQNSTHQCHLFGRKFAPSSLDVLFSFASMLGI